eukprot:TRINITY_DN44454_c0_g1_i1.p1 TRINITY_DN44454_c0_g1~~TRINITY_DN44454_c0_g1_i1.p1  ORF type:complete len:429 (+),score=63.45 TRINITY_DN44454_c0_g1_i1:82-1368(+)
MGRGGTRKCWKCGGHGHTQVQCQAVTPQGNHYVIRCFICGSDDGHGARKCPKRTPADDKWPQREPKIERVICSPSAGDKEGHRLSVLVTTSPVPSNPSTMMLEAVLASFSRVKGLADCPLVIVCDGFKTGRIQSTWKAGKITEDAAERYEEYKANLERLLENGTLPRGTKIVIMEGHNGQAFGVKAGLAHVESDYVLVHQHDLEFTFDFHVDKVIAVLDQPDNNVKYVGLPLLVNLHYESCAWRHGVRVAPENHGDDLQLMPLVFWYDSTHIASVQHYRDLIFGEQEVYSAGNFIEETFGVRQREDIMARGMDVAHAKYGTYHLISRGADGERRALIMHLNGVRFLTPEQRLQRGFPEGDPSVEQFPSRCMMNRRQRRLKIILDAMMAFVGLEKSAACPLRDILSKELNKTRHRIGAPASQCLASCAT